MSVKKILIISSYGYIEGDVAMYILPLPYLNPEHFKVYAATIPRGAVYEKFKSMPNVQIIPLELGGQELSITNKFGKIKRGIDFLNAVRRLAQLVRKEKIEVIYTLDRGVPPYIAYIVSHITGSPLIFGAHASYYLKTSRTLPRVFKHAARIITTSEHMSECFRPYVKSPQKLVAIPNAIDISKYDPNLSGEYLRQEYNIKADDKVVLLAGRLVIWKGQDDLIKAAVQILKEKPNTYFLLAGAVHSEEYKTYLDQLITDYGVGDRVKFIGYRNDLSRVIAASDICTMPSWEEPFGLVALEAMAMGKVVVATNKGGVPEFIEDGKSGFLISPRNPDILAKCLLELLNDPVKCQIIGKAARQRAEQFDKHLYSERIGKALAVLSPTV